MSRIFPVSRNPGTGRKVPGFMVYDCRLNGKGSPMKVSLGLGFGHLVSGWTLFHDIGW